MISKCNKRAYCISLNSNRLYFHSGFNMIYSNFNLLNNKHKGLSSTNRGGWPRTNISSMTRRLHRTCWRRCRIPLSPPIQHMQQVPTMMKIREYKPGSLETRSRCRVCTDSKTRSLASHCVKGWPLCTTRFLKNGPRAKYSSIYLSFNHYFRPRARGEFQFRKKKPLRKACFF